MTGLRPFGGIRRGPLLALPAALLLGASTPVAKILARTCRADSRIRQARQHGFAVHKKMREKPRPIYYGTATV